MKQLAPLLALTLLAGGALHAEPMRGLIAYGDCAEDKKTTVELHAKCAKGKDRDYQVLVFANSGDKKVYELIDEGEVEEFLGKLVVIEGKIEDGFVLIDKIEAAK